MFVLNDAKVKMLKKKKTEEEEDKLRLQQLQQDIIPPNRERKETKSRYAFNEPIVPPVSIDPLTPVFLIPEAALY